MEMMAACCLLCYRGLVLDTASEGLSLSCAPLPTLCLSLVEMTELRGFLRSCCGPQLPVLEPVIPRPLELQHRVLFSLLPSYSRSAMLLPRDAQAVKLLLPYVSKVARGHHTYIRGIDELSWSS